MSLLEQQNTLARLYTDPVFRGNFYADPAAVGSSCGLESEEIEALLALERAEVEHFSDSLLCKRLREVERLLPITRGVMGESFRREFLIFAPRFSPGGEKKHYEDALAFCTSIISGVSPPLIKDAALFEMTRLRFNAEERKLTFCLIHAKPPFTVAGGAENESKSRRHIAVWFRIRTRVFYTVL